jgi:hypothetical protein
MEVKVVVIFNLVISHIILLIIDDELEDDEDEEIGNEENELADDEDENDEDESDNDESESGDDQQPPDIESIINEVRKAIYDALFDYWDDPPMAMLFATILDP